MSIMADINKNINLDPDMPSPELDKVTLTPAQKTKGLIQCIIFSIIGIFVFFGQFTVNGESDTVFGVLYNSFLNIFGSAIYWVLALIIGANFLCHLYFKYVKKGSVKNAFADIYANNSIVHTMERNRLCCCQQRSSVSKEKTYYFTQMK